MIQVTVPSEIGAVRDRVNKKHECDDAEGVNTDGDNGEADG